MLKQRLKIIIAVICVVITAAALTGCGSAAISKPTPNPGTAMQSVTGSCSIVKNGNVITVSGETSFEAGTKINISVVGQDGMTIDNVTIDQPEANAAISQDFTVSDKYAGVSSVQGFITVAPSLYGSQPDNISLKYGKNFGNISGEYIWDKDGVIVIFASEDMITLS